MAKSYILSRGCGKFFFQATLGVPGTLIYADEKESSEYLQLSLEKHRIKATRIGDCILYLPESIGRDEKITVVRITFFGGADYNLVLRFADQNVEEGIPCAIWKSWTLRRIKR